MRFPELILDWFKTGENFSPEKPPFLHGKTPGTSMASMLSSEDFPNQSIVAMCGLGRSHELGSQVMWHKEEGRAALRSGLESSHG